MIAYRIRGITQKDRIIVGRNNRSYRRGVGCRYRICHLGAFLTGRCQEDQGQQGQEEFLLHIQEQGANNHLFLGKKRWKFEVLTWFLVFPAQRSLSVVGWSLVSLPDAA